MFRGLRRQSAKQLRIEGSEQDKVYRKRVKWVSRMELGKQYHDAIHTYEMSLGGVRLGRKVDMTGREAHLRNKALERKFIDRLSASGRAGQLSRWVLARPTEKPQQE